MERNKGIRRQNARTKRRAVLSWLVTRLVAVILLIACIISFVSTQATLNEKRQEQAELEAAIENLNYAYPNERRFYDTSRN